MAETDPDRYDPLAMYDEPVGEVGAHTPNPLAQTIIPISGLLPPRIPRTYKRVGGNLNAALEALDPSQLKYVEYLKKMIGLSRGHQARVRFYEIVGALVLISSLAGIEVGPRHSRDIKKLGPMIRPLLNKLRGAK